MYRNYTNMPWPQTLPKLADGVGSKRRVWGRPRSHRGFTLIEAALTTVIVGTGVLAIVAAQQAYHRKNHWSQMSGTGMLLANELRELTMSLPLHDPLTGTANFGPEPGEMQPVLQDDGWGLIALNPGERLNWNDLDDFAGIVNSERIGSGTVFMPPINALRQPVGDMDGWAQRIRVENVLPDNISATFTQPLGTTDLMRVTVTVTYQQPNTDEEPVTISKLVWIVTR